MCVPGLSGDYRHPAKGPTTLLARVVCGIASTANTPAWRRRNAMDWPTTLVLIAVIIAVMAVLTTYINGRFSNK